MPELYILSLLGPDRAGLVEALSGAVSKLGGNWLESRMARLGGQFAGVARIELPAGSRAGLDRAVASLAQTGLSVSVAADSASPAQACASGLRAEMELVGQDRPGIVSQVTSVLSRAGANVEDFSSVVESAAMAGGMLFRCSATLSVPDEAALDGIRRELERLAADLMVDVSVSRA